MEKKQSSQRKEARATRQMRTSAPERGALDTTFDSWLENKLKTAYSSVLDEPIPDDLIRLISQKLKD